MLANVDRLVIGISIHAPVKGATPAFDDPVTQRVVISIHAPVKGATFSFQIA